LFSPDSSGFTLHRASHYYALRIKEGDTPFPSLSMAPLEGVVFDYFPYFLRRSDYHERIRLLG